MIDILKDPGLDENPRSAALVRLADGDDIDVVVDVATRVFRATYAPITGEEYVQLGLAKWWSPGAVADRIGARRLLVATVDDAVVGVASWTTQKERAVIGGVYVLPGVRGVGVGTALMRTIYAAVEDTGREDVYIGYVFGNEPTRRWLESQGFVEQWHDEGNDVIPTQVWTRKMLNPSATAAASALDS